MEGYVYILSNPVMPGLVKIGFTTEDDINVRLSGLFQTGVPVPFDVEYACRIPDCKKVERALHRAFHPQRTHARREFFNIEPDQAIAILELFEAIDLTSDVIRRGQENALPEDIAATKKARKRRPNMNFFEMGLAKGDVIQYIPSLSDDMPITVTIEEEKKVRFLGETRSPSSVTTELRETDYQVQPGPYWTTTIGDLSDLYERTYG